MFRPFPPVVAEVLARHTLGERGSGSRVTLAHGFTQNAACWSRFGARLASEHAVTAVDAPGHGDSGHDHVDLGQAGRLLTEAGGSSHFVGYSMGGRAALQAALDDAEGEIRSLVLIGATAGIDDDDDRAERAAADRDLAATIREIGTEAFVDRWLTNPLFASLAPEQACRRERLRNRAEGLAASLERCGTGSMEPLWSRLPSIDIPVLVIAGTRDSKFTEIGRRLAAAIPGARFDTIEGGHAVHLENPDEAAAVVIDWLSTLG